MEPYTKKNFDRKTSSCPDSICIISNVRGRYCRKYCTHHNSITQEYCTTNFVSVNQSFYFDAKIRSALQSSDRSHLSNIFSRNNQAKSNPRKWGGGWWGSNFKLNKDVISRFGILKYTLVSSFIKWNLPNLLLITWPRISLKQGIPQKIYV